MAEPTEDLDTAAHGIATGSRSGAVSEMPDALRHDVRLLGELLGTVITESGGPELLADVERLRELAIRAYTEAGTEAFDEAAAFVDGLDLERAELVARAFTCYFHLVNLAEEFHRIRVLREREDSAGAERDPEDSLAAAIRRLRTELGDEETLRRVSELEFRPVLTAHPTEARRRAVAACIRRISDLVAQRDDPRATRRALADNTRALLSEIDTLWRTSPLRLDKPTPLDEVRTAMGIFDETLFTVLPQVYRAFDDLLTGPDAAPHPPVVPAFVRLGSWIGADRDGNPNVTASSAPRPASAAR